jgi:hypothetical protein
MHPSSNLVALEVGAHCQGKRVPTAKAVSRLIADRSSGAWNEISYQETCRN